MAEESFETEKKKRERKANYSPKETDKLVDLVIKRKDILENKKNGTQQWQEKIQAWEEIERDFNNKSNGSYYRDSKTLRIKYESLKKDIRKKWLSSLAKRRDANGKLPKFTAAEKRLKETMQLPIEEGFCDFSNMDDKCDDDDSDNSSDCTPLDSYTHTKDSEWQPVKEETRCSDEDEISHDAKNAVIEFQPVGDGEPPSKKIHIDSCVKNNNFEKTNNITTDYVNDHEQTTKHIHEDPFTSKAINQGIYNDEYSKDMQREKLEAMKLQTELLRHDIELKKLQKTLMEEELSHKKTIHDLEKQHLLLKIEALKSGKYV